MGKYLEDIVGDNPLATFLGFWSVMGVYYVYKITAHYSSCSLVNALYSYNGIELVDLLIYAT